MGWTQLKPSKELKESETLLTGDNLFCFTMWSDYLILAMFCALGCFSSPSLVTLSLGRKETTLSSSVGAACAGSKIMH